MTNDRPGRDVEKKSGAGHLPTSEPEFPNLTAMQAFDRQQHIQKGIEAGLTREQAEKHADEHAEEWTPKHVGNKVD